MFAWKLLVYLSVVALATGRESSTDRESGSKRYNDMNEARPPSVWSLCVLYSAVERRQDGAAKVRARGSRRQEAILGADRKVEGEISLCK